MALFIKIVCLILFGCLITIIIKKTAKTVIRILCIWLLVLGFVLFSIFPIDKFFLSANTPEQAFRQTIASGKIIDIIYGNYSCMIYYSTDELNYSFCFFNKNNDEYQAVDFISINVVSAYRNGADTIYVYQLPSTNEYYLFATLHSDNHEMTIEDAQYTNFHIHESYSDKKVSSYNIQAFLNEYNEFYSVQINHKYVLLSSII